MSGTIDYRSAGAVDGQHVVSVERSPDAAVVTIDFGEAGRQDAREQVSTLTAFLVVWVIMGGLLGWKVVRSVEEWIGLGVLFGVSTVLIMLAIARQRRELNADRWWRLTASAAGLQIEQQNRDGSAYSQKIYPRDRIRDVTIDCGRGEGRDEYEVCIYAPLPHRVPVRYFNVRRHEAEIIVNAIREGLRL